MINKLEFPLKILLIIVLITHLAYYLILPIFPIVLKVSKGLIIEQIGVVLAVSSFSYQGGSILGGYLADQFGRRFLVAVGALIKGAALIGFGLVDSYGLLIFIAVFNGLGGGLHSPSIKAAIAVLASKNQSETTVFSLRGIAANFGIAVGGLVVYFFIQEQSSLVFYIAAALFVLVSFLSWFLLTGDCLEEPCERVSWAKISTIFQNKAFVIFSVINIFIWGLYVQFALALPLKAETFLNDSTSVSLIWTVNSIFIVLSQTFITKRFLKRTNPMNALSIGVLFLGTGISLLYWANSFVWLILCGLLFIIGEMMIMPTVDTMISHLGKAQLIGTYFGLSNFIFGLGEGLGNFGGARLLGIGLEAVVPWLTYALISLVIAMSIFTLRLRVNANKS